ncbi:MAG: aminotransferase class V-fold PLP-dependent enzyme [SAR202 cluster bacterium]|nr:aminotransferase class V-fold PLP-dependent enzyme [SAR202 cluster bacterium]
MPTYKRQPSIYERLGIPTVINAQSWVTMLGGSLMRPEVFAAMEEAGRHFVEIEKLHDVAGNFVAKAVGAEAGFVCAGAAAGNLLMSAAVMTGTDEAKVEQLPDTTGMKSEILIFKCQRNYYDKAFEVAGARLVDVGMPGGAKQYHLEAAFSENTAAVAYVFAPFMKYPLSLFEVVEIAHSRGVPVVVDASAEVPPVANLRRYTEEGADLVTFSGGKGLRGPQNSGILAGKKELVRAARMNYQYPGPSRAGVARAAKVSKETLVGMITALDLFLKTDHEAEWAAWRAMAEHIAGRLKDISGLRVVVEEEENRQGPQPVIYFESGWSGPSPSEVRQRLRDGDPPIFVGGGGYGDEINMAMVNVQEGEEKIIADRLLSILKPARKSGPVVDR